jgi:hypothetical protein
MCSTYQSMGLWSLVGITALLMLPLGTVLGWKALAVKLSHQRMKSHLQVLKPLGGKVVKMAIGLMVVAFLGYAYLL